MTSRTLRKNRRARPRGRHASPEARGAVRALLGDAPRRRDLLVEHLHKLQDHYGHLPAEALTALAEEMSLPTAELYEVATFYHHFEVVKAGEPAPPAVTVRVCDSITCELEGCAALVAALGSRLGPEVRVQRVPCVGRCASAPVAVVGTNPIERATLERVSSAVEARATEAPLPAGYIDYAAYRAGGGYETLLRCVRGELDEEAVLSRLEAAHLRGLGGAGFPAGRKWRALRDQPAPRLAAINIDEGEPGTFKDRHFLERDPHRFIEGGLIAARVIGIDELYIYLRDEYAGCRKMLEKELAALRADPPCELPPLHLRRGAGAYICGEESAMIESIEGKRGMPRHRPPLVAQVGLWGRPTLEHNLETLHWVRDILEHGPERFAREGRRGRKGLRAFSVSGRVRHPGVHMAPAGISARELIDEHCGGMQPGHALGGYFTGGASGGILPASLGDVALDFDTLQEHGCFIGSAAIIVLSEQDSVRRAALNAMRFFQHESCGKCTPCRVGTEKAAELMEAEAWDRPLLQALARAMADASICGLGQAAPNPLLCTLKYFPDEVSHGG